jgi:DNA-binding SARP family transcriptional activator/tetratricopeptide (TPR) repeat protein
VRFRVLGPVEVEADDGRVLTLRRRQERCLLAVLLLQVGQVLSAERLCSLLWPDGAPRQPHRDLRTHVARIRSMLLDAGAAGHGVALLSQQRGYVLEADPETIDAHRFRRLVDSAALATDLAERQQLLRAALAEWRGPALEHAVSDQIRLRLCAELDELHLRATEELLATGLDLGRHRELLPELARLATAQPVRERLVELHMRALYQQGRTAEALDVYRDARARLAEDLGLDPGPALTQLQRMILRGEPLVTAQVPEPAVTPARPAAIPAQPAQLPPDQPSFVGRQVQLEKLDRLVGEQTTVAGRTVVVSAIAGTAGVGKTALAVHWAHRSRTRFPDGQLYVNLRGYAPGPPVRPAAALAGFLAALGVPTERIPVTLDEASALFRSLLADRRMLVVLDNAADADQVRPLLPAAKGCLVLVTSRDRLGGLIARDGAVRLNLDVLTADEAYQLLSEVIGPHRVAAEPGATADLARMCAYLPLALRIAAANLSEYPDRRISGYVADLRAGDRLSALAVAGDEQTAVRTALDLSYHDLPSAAARLFRLTGLVPGPEVTTDAAAALAGISAEQAAALVDRLVCAHLLTMQGPDRYTCHDLLRSYADELCRRDDEAAERAAAVARLYRYYLAHTRAALALLRPDTARLPAEPDDPEPPQATFTNRPAAAAWLDAERPNLMAAVVRAADEATSEETDKAVDGADRRRMAVRLADALRGYFWMRTLVFDWLTVAQCALTAARRDGNRCAEAAAELSLGDALHSHGEYREAICHHEQALALARRCGWQVGEATILNNLGTVHQRAGELRRALDLYQQSLALRERLGDSASQSGPLLNLGTVTSLIGDLRSAKEYHARAIALFESIGSQQGVGLALANLGETCHRLGHLAEARRHLTRALAVLNEVRHNGLIATVLSHLADLDADTAQPEPALERIRSALTILQTVDDSRYEPGVLNAAGQVHRRLGQPVEASGYHERALGLARETGAREHEIGALAGLAFTHSGRHHIETARSAADAAVALAQESGYHYLEAYALAASATVELAAGRTNAAAQLAQRAIDIQHSAGCRIDEARCLVLLGHTAEPGTAQQRTAWQHAIALFRETGVPDAENVEALLARFHPHNETAVERS